MNNEQLHRANTLKDAIFLCDKLLRYFDNPDLYQVHLEIPNQHYANNEDLWVKNKSHKIIIDHIKDGIQAAKKDCEEEFNNL